MKTLFSVKGHSTSIHANVTTRRIRTVLRCGWLLGLLGFALDAAFAQPANDLFGNAQIIVGASGSVAGNTAGASKEPGEPNHAGNAGGNSIWYAWRAPLDGLATFTTFGTDFDTLLAVYTGSEVTTLSAVAADDDAGGIIQSRLEFMTEAGQTYYITVDGYDGGSQSGKVLLSWNVGPHTNDNFASAQVLEGARGTLATTAIGATKEPGEPNHGGNAGGHSLWFCWRATASGVVTFNTFGGSFDTLLAVYTGSDLGALSLVTDNDDAAGINTSLSEVFFNASIGQVYWIAVDGFGGASGQLQLNWSAGLPPNDNFINATIISGRCGSTNGITLLAGKEPGEPNHAGDPGGASIWYAWTAPVDGPAMVNTFGSPLDTLLAVYTGPRVDTLTLVAMNDDAVPDAKLQSRVDFTATAGVTYYIAVDGFDGFSGFIKLTWSAGVPANNEFFSPQPLTGLSGHVKGTTFSATKDFGEPDHAGNPGGHSIWYEWTPSQTGVATVNLAGSSFDTLLAVYTGTDVDFLMPIAANDDTADGIQSRVNFAAGGGVRYLIAVDGFSGADGLISLSYQLAPPPVLQITRSGSNVIINWSGPYRLESTTALANPSSATLWTPVVGAAPVSLPISESGRTFFRTVFP